MRAAFSLVSLLVVIALVAYFYTAQPALMEPTGGAGSYQHLQQRAETAAAQLAHDPQADIDAATTPTTNAPAAAPRN